MSVTPALALAMEVEKASSGKSPAAMGKTARDVLDLFVGQSLFLREPEVAVFDEVLLRLLPHLDLRDRIAMAERLADIDNAPRKLVGRLALSEAAVAIPVLERSLRLTEEDLITICATQSSAHLLALAARPRLSAGVTDQILAKASRDVLRSVAMNPGARFSPAGLSRLVEKAKGDDLLFKALESRDDLPPEVVRALIEASLEEVRTRLRTDLGEVDHRHPDDILASITVALDRSPSEEDETSLRAARRRVRDQILEADLTADTLDAWIGEECVADVVAGLAQLAGVEAAAALGAFGAPLPDALILLARLADLPPGTAEGLFAFRGRAAAPARSVSVDLALFARLSRTTARCVLRHWAAARTLDRRG